MSIFTKIIDLQKLNSSWDRVRKNKPAAGVDDITYDIFEEQKREQLKQLNLELLNHEYETLPVKKITIYKGDKSRDISLYSMRDKVVQQSLALELNKIYEPVLSDCAYAYRNEKSALLALERIEAAVKQSYQYALRLDIEHFFDSISKNVLQGILGRRIREKDVMYLIEQNSFTRVLEDTGEILDQEIGIHQGSGISPILSNIYLMEFDQWMGGMDVLYIRYSDDILILGKNIAELMDLRHQIELKLGNLGLKLNEKKCALRMISDGFEFLGHAFDKKGKSVPQKAKDNLLERLEMMWLTSGVSITDKIKKSKEIINGWEQYFRGDRKIESIFEYITLIHCVNRKTKEFESLIQERANVVNIYKDIAIYLANVWKEMGIPNLQLLEYEEFYQISNKEYRTITSSQVRELLEFYQKAFIHESEDVATEIMQIYTDAGEYEKASFWMNRKTEVKKKMDPVLPISVEKSDPKLMINHGTVDRILRYFVGREDIYSLENLSEKGKRQSELQLLPLENSMIMDHINGKLTIGTYIQRPNSTVKYIIFDVDISKKILLQYRPESTEFQEYLKIAFENAMEIKKQLRNYGMESYIEFSGFRGYHVWLLLEEWVPVRYVNMLCDLMEQKIDIHEDITLEFFPNKTRVKEGKYGQCIKLPYGYHGKSNQLSYFVDADGGMIKDVNAYMDTFAVYHLSAIKKVLAANTSYSDISTKEIEISLDGLNHLSEPVKVVLNNCNLMKYLYQKAERTGYLSHFERLSVLYVFAHMGEEGHEFIHFLMGKTLNYQYQVTDRFINKVPGKPISCVKLRNQYKSITAEYGCSCNFKRTKNCYPSPVLHAIQLSKDTSTEVTVPTSKTLTKEKEQKVLDELNIHKKAEELARKILELKKQQRRVGSSIQKVEIELSRLYDQEGIDCLETELGMLVRRKKIEGYEWLIEI